MEYILIPSESKSETAFFVSLLRKMQKQVATVSSEKMEDIAFMAALKEAEQTPKGSLNRVKAHLAKLTSNK